MPAARQAFSCLEAVVYAVVRTGGKQYRVQEGRSLTIDRLPGEPGETIELRDVLLLSDGESVTVGNPLVEGARVLGTIAEQGRAKKIIVFRYKAKTRSRKKTGHRQPFTRLTVEDILAPGQEPKPKVVAAEPAEEPVEPAPKRRRRAKAAEPEAVAEAEAAAEETTTVEDAQAATDEAPVEAAEPEAKPKRSRKKSE
jgi:large subunit ribosomal protein L21